jgi:hypothetical protein
LSYKKQLIAPWAQSLVPETCRGAAVLERLGEDSVRRAKADFPLVPLCPVKSMAPVLAIAGMVARGSRYDGPLTPLGRFSKPFVTGPNWIPFSSEESSDDGRQQVVAEPEGEERMGPAIAIGRSWTGSTSSACGRNRCGEQRALRCIQRLGSMDPAIRIARWQQEGHLSVLCELNLQDILSYAHYN